MELWKEEQLDQLLKEEDEGKILLTAMSMAQQLDFEFLSFGMRTPVATMQPKIIMLSNYPNEWSQRYKQENYVTVDPTVAHCLSSMLPILWSDKVFEETPEFWEEARSHGLRHGWGLSAHDHRGRASMLSVGRSHDEVSIGELYEKAGQTYWLCNLLHTVIGEKPVDPQEKARQLTDREIEVLRWSAEGKKAHEIAGILKVSERTVSFHVKSAMDKLNAPNRTSAVIQAAINGLF
ncbi:LuxR family transcriptional regulator [Pseudomonas sp. LS1212]|uniref:LuxR family transcriptional regulator n=1 Tax=Pseudomonas sp. LS1212 TaxID=2972478 RepID=UPI00215C5A3B|nr:LuxR family transcriptional regulator [Pseudomonas sp. LS1212]UVJ43393.1 LuxR family transcriptional regulator [Pseudomonas sp. LS1212]